MFDKIDEFIRLTKELLLFNYELLGRIYEKIKYLIIKKSSITNSVNYNFGKIKIDSYNYLSI